MTEEKDTVESLCDKFINDALANQPWVTGAIHEHLEAHKEALKAKLKALAAD